MIVLQDFSFGNFRSFKEIQTLSLSKADLLHQKDIDLENTNTFVYNNEYFLKTKAIYGANASGKSNVVKALTAFLQIITDSVKNTSVLNEVVTFMDVAYLDEPSFLQLIFWVEGVRYRYGFEVTRRKISSEWLYAAKAEEEVCYFIREENEIIELNEVDFAEGAIYLNLSKQGEENEEVLLGSSLFLTVLASFGFGKLSKYLIHSLNDINIISELRNPEMMDAAKEALRDKDKRGFIIDILKKGDTSIDDLTLAEVTEYPSEKVHKNMLFASKKRKTGVGEALLFFEASESEGTRKLFELSPYLYEAIRQGKPLVIDEFDARFHPLLTKRIIQLFNSAENKRTQFIFVTHDTSLLSGNLLRRDQIEFVEKDKEGASHLYALAEIEGVPDKGSFERDYIQGKYGAVPLVEDFTELIAN